MNVQRESTLTTEAEQCAVEATKLQAFLGVDLRYIKREVAHLLSLIGTRGFFEEYPKHDISHIDAMLKLLYWLIPKSTKEKMTSSDWLLTVLAIYFHDLGMLISPEEYHARGNSGFEELRQKVSGNEKYRSRAKEQPGKDFELFLYEEFVRRKHAQRVKMWIQRKSTGDFGITTETAQAVDTILKAVNMGVREDLGNICESHHLNDLDNLEKYEVYRKYGTTREETVNLHYAAILLRTSDLLHITRDRTPTIIFDIINVTNPVSVLEWQKQMGVANVSEQNENANNMGNIIEVQGYFEQDQAESYFNLLSYLKYAEKELQQSYRWVELAHRLKKADHEFPWYFIDTQKIQTQGFSSENFELKITSTKFLELISVHPRYKDVNAVIRELIQNALDAIRLQHFKSSMQEQGKIEIEWDSKQRILSVKDNGTGMTQNIIKSHLLRVGTSYYHDPDFKRLFSDFTPISKFGIGLLSTFVIAETIQITTNHPDEDMACQFSLRLEAEKYVVRLFDKYSDVARGLGNHGTLIKLKVKSGLEIPNIIIIASKLIIVPEHQVYVKVDDTVTRIGFSSLKEALTKFLQAHGIPVDETPEQNDNGKVQVRELEREGVTLAFALEPVNLNGGRNFLRPDILNIPPENKRLMLGTCIEGLRIKFETPGFKIYNIVSIVNTKIFNTAPIIITLSYLEASTESSSMLQTVYSLYCEHIEAELHTMQNMYPDRLTMVTQEARRMLSPLLLGGDTCTVNANLLNNAIQKLPLLLFEYHGRRSAISLAKMQEKEFFWTIDSRLLQSMEQHIYNTPGDLSLSSMIKRFKTDSSLPDITDPESMLPQDEVILCAFEAEDPLHPFIFMEREADKIFVDREQRRIDVRWAKRSDPPRWLQVFETSLVKNLQIEQNGVEKVGLEDKIAICIFNKTYLLESPVSVYLIKWLSQKQAEQSTLDFLFGLVQSLLSKGGRVTKAREYIQTYLEQEEVKQRLGIQFRLENVFDDVEELYTLIEATTWDTFDASIWIQRDSTKHTLTQVEK